MIKIKRHTLKCGKPWKYQICRVFFFTENFRSQDLMLFSSWMNGYKEYLGTLKLLITSERSAKVAEKKHVHVSHPTNHRFNL